MVVLTPVCGVYPLIAYRLPRVINTQEEFQHVPSATEPNWITQGDSFKIHALDVFYVPAMSTHYKEFSWHLECLMSSGAKITNEMWKQIIYQIFHDF